jgi:hypothetical protein
MSKHIIYMHENVMMKATKVYKKLQSQSKTKPPEPLMYFCGAGEPLAVVGLEGSGSRPVGSTCRQSGGQAT